jgi:hypothetical protein
MRESQKEAFSEAFLQFCRAKSLCRRAMRAAELLVVPVVLTCPFLIVTPFRSRFIGVF